jgi:hypothetical protein
MALFIALGGTTYAAFALPKNSVGTKQLRNGAVTTRKIKNGAVTRSTIATGTVTGSKIANGTVTGSKIANGAVTGSKIANGAVTGSNVARGTLTAANLAPGTVPPRTGRLRSGETISGFAGVTYQAGGASVIGDAAASFQLQPRTPIPGANRHLIISGSGPNCPGIGQAAPGHLCAYETNSFNVASKALLSETTSTSGFTTYGFILNVSSTATGEVDEYVDWAYTEP